MSDQPGGDPAAALPLLCGALVASAATLSALAWFLAPPAGAAPTLGAIALWTLTAVAIVPMIAAPVVEQALPAAAVARGEDAAKAGALAKIVGFALREATALLGALITFLTGQRMFVAMLGGLALLGMLIAWPSSSPRDAIDPS